MQQMSSLQEEMLVHIFVKSCVKSVGRLSCVCKAWRDLIKTPYFSGKYFISQNQHVLLRWSNPILDDYDSYQHVLLTLISSQSVSSVSVKLPFDIAYGAVQSCNGILCYSYRYDLCILYHPFTREHLTLPESLYKVSIDRDEGVITTIKALGFGFDSSNSDYKIIRVWRGKRLYAEIYRLSTNSWSELYMEEDGGFVYGTGMFLNGVYHWRRLESNSDHVKNLLTFNFQDERFGCMECPRGCRKGLLGVLDESLAICSYKHRDQPTSEPLEGIEIWIMREYGKTESWTKTYCISNEILGLGIRSIVTFWIHGMKLVLLGNNGKVVVYENDKAAVMSALDGDVTRGVVFRPSLPSLHSRRLDIGGN